MIRDILELLLLMGVLRTRGPRVSVLSLRQLLVRNCSVRLFVNTCVYPTVTRTESSRPLTQIQICISFSFEVYPRVHSYSINCCFPCRIFFQIRVPTSGFTYCHSSQTSILISRTVPDLMTPQTFGVFLILEIISPTMFF